MAGDFACGGEHVSRLGGGEGFCRHRAFDATAFGATTKAQKTANDFGGSLGGRIIRNRTFFFGTFEDMQYRTGANLQATVPTAAMRSGDFSNEGVTLKNPFTGAPFPNNPRRMSSSGGSAGTSSDGDGGGSVRCLRSGWFPNFRW